MTPPQPPAKRARVTPSPVPAEQAVGITEYLTPSLPGFHGVLKQRYTDFLVNEITPEGVVVHLRELNAPSAASAPPAPAPPPVSAAAEPRVEDLQRLTELTDAATVEGCLAVARGSEREVVTGAIPDKGVRSAVHAAVREGFAGRLLTSTLADGIRIRIIRGNAAAVAADRKRKRGGRNVMREMWQRLGGEFLHFTVYKENRDTMEVVNVLSKMVGCGRGGFAVAGTKDRRGVTVQRVAGHKVKAERLAALNRGDQLRGVKVGDFEYRKEGLRLGDLMGNEFVITLRGVLEGEEEVEKAVDGVRVSGFGNYFGLQRFGTVEGSGTADVGCLLLQGEYRKAVEKILTYDPSTLDGSDKIAADELARAKACKIFRETYDYKAASEAMPRKFVAESAILRAFCQRGIKCDDTGKGLDYLGALQGIPRGLRTMYVHAYQSLIWNNALSARLRISRTDVLEGDLVIAEKEAGGPAKEAPKAGNVDELDQDGEIIVSAEMPEEDTEDAFVRARPLSAEEVASGKWSIRDIVLPTPGWDVVYPSNPQLMDIYNQLMQKDGLDPMNMKRSVREFSLPGSYRKCVAAFLDGVCEVEVKEVMKEEQVVVTDLETVQGSTGEKRKREQQDQCSETEKVVVLKMRLGTSTYATMALREIMKGGTESYRPEFGRAGTAGEKA